MTPNDNVVKLVNYNTSKNLTVKSTTCPQHNIYKHTLTFSDGMRHNQIDIILTDKRRHSSVTDF